MADESGRRVALITGAGRGLGRTIAIKLAVSGYAFALTARTSEELEKTRRLSGLAARDALIILADLKLDDAPEQIFDTTLDHFGRLDVLINAAHVNTSDESFLGLDAEKQDRLLAVNLRAPITLARMSARHMLKQATLGTIITFFGFGKACDAVSAAVDAGILAFSQTAMNALHTGQVTIGAIPFASVDHSAIEEVMKLICKPSTDHHDAVILED